MIRSTTTFVAVFSACFLALGFASEANAAAGPLPGETLSQSYRESQAENVGYQKLRPFKMFDNLYHVGPGYVGVYLLTTSDGLILIDSGEEPYVEWILENIRTLGFYPENIEYILIAHGHCDHFCGAARIQEASGARVVAMPEDWDLIEAYGERGREGDQPVPERDVEAYDGMTITLGDTTVLIHKTTGHTPGVLSAEFTVYDHGTPHKAYYAGGVSGRGGVEGMQPALEASARTREIQNVEVFLPNHAWTSNPFPNGGVYERMERLFDRGPGDPNPFVDGEAWEIWIEQAHQQNIENLEAARAEAAAGN